MSVPLGEYGGARYALNVSTPNGRMTEQARSEIAEELAVVVAEVRPYFL